jgi:hypothetical protein
MKIFKQSMKTMLLRIQKYLVSTEEDKESKTDDEDDAHNGVTIRPMQGLGTMMADHFAASTTTFKKELSIPNSRQQ